MRHELKGMEHTTQPKRWCLWYF